MNRNSCIYWIGLLTEGSSVINAENFPFTFILQIALSPLVRFFLSISLSLSVIYARTSRKCNPLVLRWYRYTVCCRCPCPCARYNIFLWFILLVSWRLLLARRSKQKNRVDIYQYLVRAEPRPCAHKLHLTMCEDREKCGALLCASSAFFFISFFSLYQLTSYVVDCRFSFSQ